MHVKSTATSARRTHTHASKTMSRTHPGYSQSVASRRSKGRRAPRRDNQGEEVKKKSKKSNSVLNCLGCNWVQNKPRKDLRDRLNARRRSPDCASINNQHQEQLPGNIRMEDLRQPFDVLNRWEEELSAGYHNFPFSWDIEMLRCLLDLSSLQWHPMKGKQPSRAPKSF